MRVAGLPGSGGEGGGRVELNTRRPQPLALALSLHLGRPGTPLPPSARIIYHHHHQPSREQLVPLPSSLPEHLNSVASKL